MGKMKLSYKQRVCCLRVLFTLRHLSFIFHNVDHENLCTAYIYAFRTMQTIVEDCMSLPKKINFSIISLMLVRFYLTRAMLFRVDSMKRWENEHTCSYANLLELLNFNMHNLKEILLEEHNEPGRFHGHANKIVQASGHCMPSNKDEVNIFTCSLNSYFNGNEVMRCVFILYEQILWRDVEYSPQSPIGVAFTDFIFESNNWLIREINKDIRTIESMLSCESPGGSCSFVHGE